MSQFTGAVIKEQGITFSIMLVKNGYATQTYYNDIQHTAPRNLPRPIILAEQRGSTFNYFGKPDIVNFLASVHPSQIPWRKYSAN